MDRKYNVLVVPSDKFGCGLHRSLNPHIQLDKLNGDNFNVEINRSPHWADLCSFDRYDQMLIRKRLYN